MGDISKSVRRARKRVRVNGKFDNPVESDHIDCDSTTSDFEGWTAEEEQMLMESKNRMMTDGLKWLDGADSQLRAFYSGNSRSTRYRKLAEREERAKDAALCRKITSYFAATSNSPQAPQAPAGTSRLQLEPPQISPSQHTELVDALDSITKCIKRVTSSKFLKGNRLNRLNLRTSSAGQRSKIFAATS